MQTNREEIYRKFKPYLFRSGGNWWLDDPRKERLGMVDMVLGDLPQVIEFAVTRRKAQIACGVFDRLAEIV